MKISFKECLLFILVAVIGFFVWLKFGYPQFSFMDLSVDKTEALREAESYLSSLKVDTAKYSKAIIFESDDWPDRYLQKTIGFQKTQGFIKENNYELFAWKIRFFRESKKEEYIVRVGAGSGRILNFEHLIEDVTARQTLGKEDARRRAEEFLRDYFRLNLKDYDFLDEKVKRYDNRTDYSFSWEKKGIYIPWKKDEGGARLLIGATVSGSEIRSFYKGALDIPEKFRRYIQKELAFGEFLYSFYFIVFIFLISWSIFIVVKNRSYVISAFCKKWYVSLAIFIFLINLLLILNNFHGLLMGYQTSVSLATYLGNYFIKVMLNILLFSFAFILPGVAGESLRTEVFEEKQYSSFLYYLRSTFLSRSISRAVLFGYALFFIMLGLQSGLFYFGQKYLGVWKEWQRLVQFSSSWIPFLSAFIVGANASLNEEVIFRLFGICWAKKYLKNTIVAVVFAAVVWGFGHSGYAIFPVWFRGIEVSTIGLFFGFIFLRYGIIPLIIAHYLFDAFIGVSGYILAPSSAYLFISSVFILIFPLVFSCAAYLINRPEKVRQIQTLLTRIQEYNLGILIAFVSDKKSQGLGAEAISKELIEHNWDMELVNLAISEVFKT